MTTFVLKKYEEQPLSPNTAEVDKPQPPQAGTAAPAKEINILVQGSIAEIVGAALRKALGRDVEITEVTDSSDASVKALSTEAINTDPLATFRSIQANDAVFIQNHGFTTREEEWFLTNLPNKTSNVFYTVESFVRYVCAQLEVPCHEG